MDEFLIDDPYLLGPPLEAPKVSLDYPPALPKDLALFPERHDEVLAYHNTTPQQYEQLLNNLTFRRECAEWQRRVVAESYGITARAEALVKEGLVDLSRSMADPDVGVETKLRIQSYFANLAGLTNKKESGTSGSNAPQVNIQINL